MRREDQKYLRKKTEELLRNYRFRGEKIHLPDEYLDELLFDYAPSSDGKKVGFFSDYLYKLDLSNASFDGATLDNEFYGDRIINLKNTNVKIDLSKTIEYQKFKVIAISNIDLENVDLSNNDLESLSKIKSYLIQYIRNSNLKNTGLTITDETSINFTNCRLTGNDLSNTHLIIDTRTSHNDENIILANDSNLKLNYCDLSFTKANLSVNQPIMKYQYNNLLTNPNLRGCYFQDILLGSSETESKEKDIKETNYLHNHKSSERVSKILTLINKQVSDK